MGVVPAKKRTRSTETEHVPALARLVPDLSGLVVVLAGALLLLIGPMAARVERGTGQGISSVTMADPAPGVAAPTSVLPAPSDPLGPVIAPDEVTLHGEGDALVHLVFADGSSRTTTVELPVTLSPNWSSSSNETRVALVEVEAVGPGVTGCVSVRPVSCTMILN